MSGWEVGDLALCVSGKRGAKAKADRVADGCPIFVIGGVYTVEGVVVYLGALGLVIEGIYSNHPTRSWKASNFVKVTPPAADEFDRETIALMNRVGEPVQ